MCFCFVFLYYLYNDIGIYIPPVVHARCESSSALRRLRNFENLVEQNPLMFYRVGFGELVSDIYRRAQRTTVGRDEVERHFETVFRIGQFAEGMESGIDNGRIVVAGNILVGTLHLEIERRGIVGVRTAVVQRSRTRHTRQKRYRRRHILHTLDANLHVVGFDHAACGEEAFAAFVAERIDMARIRNTYTLAGIDEQMVGHIDDAFVGFSFGSARQHIVEMRGDSVSVGFYTGIVILATQNRRFGAEIICQQAVFARLGGDVSVAIAAPFVAAPTAQVTFAHDGSRNGVEESHTHDVGSFVFRFSTAVVVESRGNVEQLFVEIDTDVVRILYIDQRTAHAAACRQNGDSEEQVSHAAYHRRPPFLRYFARIGHTSATSIFVGPT